MTIAPAITGNDGVAFVFNTGDVEEIDITIEGGLVNDRMASSPAYSSMLYDMDGCLKTITLRGILTDSGTTRTNSGTTITIDEQRQWLEKQFNGLQSLTTFLSTYGSTYDGSSFTTTYIMKGRFRHTERAGTPNGLAFELTLLVGM